MKKTLIALAAMAATGAFAQTVNVTGTFDATYRASSFEGGTGVSADVTRLGKDGIGTTGVSFSGTEDLGGGMKASFLYEHNFDVSNTGTEGTNTATGARTSTGQVFVGLEGGWGSVKLGAPNSPTLTVQGGRAGSFGTKDGGRAALSATAGGATTLMGTSVTRYDSAILYTSPSFAGFSLGVNYSPKSDTSSTVPGAGETTDIGVFYSNGPIAAGVSMFTQDAGLGFNDGGASTTASGLLNTPTLTTKVEMTSYFATYNFGVAKVGIGGHTYKKADTPEAKNSGLNLLVEAPLSSALTVTLNYQTQDDKASTNRDLTQTALGLQYAMSKRTTLYTRYIQQSVDNVTSADRMKDADRFLVGLQHKF